MKLKKRKGLRTNIPVMGMDDECDPWPGMFGDMDGGGPTLIDSCPVDRQNDIGSYGIMDNMQAVYQAFTAPRTAILESVKVSLRKEGNPTSVQVKLYVGSGAFPVMIPQSTLIASTPAIPTTNVTTDPNGALYEMPFLGNPTINAGSNYCLVVERYGGGVFYAPDKVMVGCAFDFDNNGSAHYGNAGYRNFPVNSWSADDLCDMIFYLYEKPQ